MQPRIITEVWQGVSILSDAQELLNQDPVLAHSTINHAKRHLIRALEWIHTDDAASFREAIMVLDCTLADEHMEHQVEDTGLEPPMTPPA